MLLVKHQKAPRQCCSCVEPLVFHSLLTLLYRWRFCFPAFICQSTNWVNCIASYSQVQCLLSFCLSLLSATDTGFCCLGISITRWFLHTDFYTQVVPCCTLSLCYLSIWGLRQMIITEVQISIQRSSSGRPTTSSSSSSSSIITHLDIIICWRGFPEDCSLC